MSSLTAQILAETLDPKQDPDKGEFGPTHYLFLLENFRPSWILVNQNIFDQPGVKEKRIVWIPTVENMLEDALVMIAIHVIKNKKIIDLAQKMFENIEVSHVEVYQNLTDTQRQQIYQECRRIEKWPKFVITVIGGSSIKRQLSVLKKYSIKAELCISK